MLVDDAAATASHNEAILEGRIVKTVLGTDSLTGGVDTGTAEAIEGSASSVIKVGVDLAGGDTSKTEGQEAAKRVTEASKQGLLETGAQGVVSLGSVLIVSEVRKLVVGVGSILRHFGARFR